MFFMLFMLFASFTKVCGLVVAFGIYGLPMQFRWPAIPVRAVVCVVAFAG